MMDLILVTGDVVTFTPIFGPRIVTVLAPVTISGSSRVTICGKPVCIEGDEKNVAAPATYLIPGYNPGTGIVKIKRLAPNQIAPRCLAGKKILLKGMQFIAEFTPQGPATQIGSGSPDAMTATPGMGMFTPTQMIGWAG